MTTQRKRELGQAIVAILILTAIAVIVADTGGQIVTW